MNQIRESPAKESLKFAALSPACFLKFGTVFASNSSVTGYFATFTQEYKMTIETRTSLKSDTIEKLQRLIQANIDAYDGFRESAEEIDDPQIAQLFRDIATERSKLATELQDYVEWSGTDSEGDGSIAATIHRVWINIRSKLNNGDPHVVLSEAEYGEDYIKRAYEDVLEEIPGSAINDVLRKQYAIVKSGHDRVRDLRDLYANRK